RPPGARRERGGTGHRAQRRRPGPDLLDPPRLSRTGPQAGLADGWGWLVRLGRPAGGQPPGLAPAAGGPVPGAAAAGAGLRAPPPPAVIPGSPGYPGRLGVEWRGPARRGARRAGALAGAFRRRAGPGAIRRLSRGVIAAGARLSLVITGPAGRVRLCGRAASRPRRGADLRRGLARAGSLRLRRAAPGGARRAPVPAAPRAPADARGHPRR